MPLPDVLARLEAMVVAATTPSSEAEAEAAAARDLRDLLSSLFSLRAKVEAHGSGVLEQAVEWFDAVLKEACLEEDGPLRALQLELRTHCVLTHLSPSNVLGLGEAAAGGAKEVLGRQFPKCDFGGPKSRETLRYKLLIKVCPSASRCSRRRTCRRARRRAHQPAHIPRPPPSTPRRLARRSRSAARRTSGH